MICPKCGKEFEDDNQFCPYCGEHIDAEEEHTDFEEKGLEEEAAGEDYTEIEQEHEDPQEGFEEDDYEEEADEEGKDDNETRSSKSKKIRIIIVIAVIVAILAGIAGYFVYRTVSKPTVIDLTSVMTTPEFEGIDSLAKLKTDVVVDQTKADKLVKSIDKEDRAKAVKKLLESVTYSPNQSENLSNGDEVVITAHYDETFAEENRIEVSHTQKKVTVGNLATELSVEDIRNSGIIKTLKKDAYIGEDDVTYRWLYCKSSKGNIIVAISYSDGIDYSGVQDEEGNFEEETPMRLWYINNTTLFTKSLDGVQMETWEIFGQSPKDSYDECINTIKGEGFSIEKIQ